MGTPTCRRDVGTEEDTLCNVEWDGRGGMLADGGRLSLICPTMDTTGNRLWLVKPHWSGCRCLEEWKEIEIEMFPTL